MANAVRTISEQGLADLAAEEGAVFGRDDVAPHEQVVNESVEVELTQDQFDALVSYTFNLGYNALRRSGLLALINDGDWRSEDREVRLKAIGQIWSAFTGARYEAFDDNVMASLTSRRRREAEKFLRAAYDSHARSVDRP